MTEVVTGGPVAPAATPAAPSAPAAVPAESSVPAAQTPADQASATPKGNETTPTTPESAEEKRGQSRFDRKIGRLHRERAEAQARAEFFEKQWNEAKAAQKPTAPADGAPTLAQFDYDPEKYADAKAKFETERARRDDTEKQRSESARQEHKRLVEGWADKAEKGEEKHEDFNEKVGDLSKHINVPAVAAIMEAENADDVAYFLAENPKEFERIAQLPARSQVREIGKLEAKLLATPPQPKKPSAAPAPVKPLTGTSAPESFNAQDTSDIGKWIRNRQKQVHGSRS